MIMALENNNGKQLQSGGRTARPNVRGDIAPDIAGNKIDIEGLVGHPVAGNFRHDRDRHHHRRFDRDDIWGAVTYMMGRPDKIAVWAT